MSQFLAHRVISFLILIKKMKKPYFPAKILLIFCLLFSIFVSRSAVAVVQAAPAGHEVMIRGASAVHPFEPRTKASLDYSELIDSLYAWLTGDSKECRAVKSQIMQKDLLPIQSLVSGDPDLYSYLLFKLSAYLFPEESDAQQKLAVRAFVGNFLDYYAVCENLEEDSLALYETILENYQSHTERPIQARL